MYMRCDTCTYQGPPWSLKKDWPHNLVQRCSKFAVLCPKKYAPFKECRSLVFSGRVQGMDQIHQRRVGNVVKMGGVAKAGGSSNHWHVEQSDNIPIRPSEVGTRNHELITFKLCVIVRKERIVWFLEKDLQFQWEPVLQQQRYQSPTNKVPNRSLLARKSRLRPNNNTNDDNDNNNNNSNININNDRNNNNNNVTILMKIYSYDIYIYNIHIYIYTYTYIYMQ